MKAFENDIVRLPVQTCCGTLAQWASVTAQVFAGRECGLTEIDARIENTVYGERILLTTSGFRSCPHRYMAFD